MKKTFAILIILMFVVTACGNPASVQTATAVPATPTVTVPIVTISSPTQVGQGLPGGEIVFVMDGESSDWWSYRNGSAAPINWLNPTSEQDRGVYWFKQMQDPNYVAFITNEYNNEGQSLTNNLVIFNRVDYTTPVADTVLDPETQQILSYTDFAGPEGPDTIPLMDRTTSPATINLWSFDTAGVLTKVWSLGSERQGGDSIDCTRMTRSDMIYLSPDGTKVFWRWEYAIGGDCTQTGGMMSVPYVEAPMIKDSWQVIDREGRILEADENIHDFSMLNGAQEWPGGWAGNQTFLFSKFFPYKPNTETTRECIFSVNIISHTTQDLYCDENFPPGIDGFSISPDGKFVAFGQDYDDLVILEVNTAKVVYSTAWDSTDTGYPFDSILVWSPDSQWVAWTLDPSSANNANSIFVLQREGLSHFTLYEPGGDNPTIPYLWLP